MVKVRFFKTAADLEKAVKKGVWAIEFEANWCSDCYVIKPFIQKLNDKFGSKMRCGVIDLQSGKPRYPDEEGGKLRNKAEGWWPHFRSKYGIERTPTFVFFINGEVFAKLAEPDNLEYWGILSNLAAYTLKKAKV